MLAGDLGRRTGRSESYPRSSIGVPRQVITHGTLKLTFRGGQFFGVGPLVTRNWSESQAHSRQPQFLPAREGPGRSRQPPILPRKFFGAVRGDG